MKKALLLVMVVALAVPMVAAAEEVSPGARAARQVARFLELSEEQVSAWQDLAETRRATIDPLREEIAAVGAELRAELGGDAPDPLTVGELTISIHDLRHEVGEAQVDYVEGFVALLDEEQAGRLAFIRRAERAQPLFPAFRTVGLLQRR